MKLKTLDGRLFKLLRHLILLKKYSSSDCISDRKEFEDIAESLRAITRECRSNGYDWIYSNSDIEEDPDAKGFYILPSADLSEYFEVENNRDLPQYFLSEGINTLGIDWDTERSAWYPIFTSLGAAELFIRELNLLFDKKILRKDNVDKDC